MSVERKERRRCDICGEIISDTEYWSCKRERAKVDNVYTKDGQYWIVNNYGTVTTPAPPTDVCVDCWEKMKGK